MTKWDDRINSHGAIQLIQEVKRKLDESGSPEDGSRLEDLERLKAVINYLFFLMQNSDAQLITPPMLDRLTDDLKGLSTEVDGYVSEKNGSYLEEANGCADKVLDSLYTWPGVAVPQDADGFRKSAESFRRSAGQLLRSLESEHEERKQELQKLSGSIKETAAEFQERVEQVRQEVGGLESEIENQKQLIDAPLDEQRETFAESQDSRRQTFEQQLRGQTGKFDEALTKAVENGKASIDELRQEAGSRVADIDGLKEQAEKLLDAIGRTGTTFGFKEYAIEQKHYADLWRRIAVAAIISIALLGLWILITAQTAEQLNVVRTVTKALISVPLAALATYAGKQSRSHRELERSSRKLELDIAAIDPFIALLPTEIKTSIKAETARRIFGRGYIASDDVEAASEEFLNELKKTSNKKQPEREE